jgi:hypothetical protein
MADRTYYGEDTDAGTRYQSEQSPNFMQAFPLMFIALAVGAIVALLFAPETGEKTRKQLSHAVEERFDDVVDRKALNKTMKRLEREMSDLRHKVESRF